MTMKKTQTSWVLNPPKAADHTLLTDITTQMKGSQIEDTFEVCGRKYTLETLSQPDETWADGYVDGVNFYQTGKARRIPYLTAALRAIDEIPIADLFPLPKDAPEDMRKAVVEDPSLLLAWRRDQLFKRLSADPPLLSPPVISQLWVHYQELDNRRAEVLENIGPFSKRTSDGASSLTSLQGKAR